MSWRPHDPSHDSPSQNLGESGLTPMYTADICKDRRPLVKVYRKKASAYCSNRIVGVYSNNVECYYKAKTQYTSSFTSVISAGFLELSREDLGPITREAMGVRNGRC